MKQRIFLTTVNNTRHRLDVQYFYHVSASGEFSCTTGISVAEAGMKLALSRQRIDRILVIGPPYCAGEEEKGRIFSAFSQTNIAADIRGMSEYGFLCYRIQEYMQQMDLEYLDIRESMMPDDQARLQAMVEDFRIKYLPDIRTEELFQKLSTESRAADCFEKEVCAGLTADEQRWIRHELFHRMDDRVKMRVLAENKSTSVCFLPVETDGVITLETLEGIVQEIFKEGGDDIELFLDAQGMSVTDGSILIYAFLMLNKRIGYQCSLCGLVESENDPEHFCGRVTDVQKNYHITMLIAGIEQFLDYGRDTKLKEYWKTLETADPDAEELFAGMDLVDEGISLCQIDLIAAGISMIRDLIRKPKPADGSRSLYMEMVTGAIKADYGSMLEGDELSIAELLKWSLRKGFYQQTLTIVESKIPGEFVKQGIYYYAESDADLENVRRVFNEIYWTKECWKTRYVFSDPEHYFLRYYRKDTAGGGQTREEAALKYAELRVKELGTTEGDMLPAYSCLEDTGLLQELLYTYYMICSMRNQVNHAVVKAGEPMPGENGRSGLRESLHILLESFINCYSRASEAVLKATVQKRLTREDFADYVKKHRI